MDYLGVATSTMSPEAVEEIKSMIEHSIAPMSQLVINQPVAQGQTIILPETDQDITLNMETGGVSIDSVAIQLPVTANGRVGQRIFANSDGQITLAHFYSSMDVTVNGGDYMFNPGDNCVFYRNKPNIISRITA